MPSFSIPVSGLDADSTALNTIANNLSNMNTTGFKSQATSFSDLLYQEIGSTGSGNEIQVGSGVQVATNTTNFTSGSLSSTGCTNDDVAINGSGFFVLDNNNGSQLYTRDGAFTLGSTGTLQSAGGQAVMGYSATNGVVNTSGALTDITIPTTTVMAPSATTTFSVTQTLNSGASIGDTATSPVKVYDSQGKSYEATVTYTKTGTNQWSYSVTMPDTLNSTPATAATVTDTVTPTSTVSGANTISKFNFDSSSGTLPTGATSGTLATVDGGTTLSIGGTSVTIPAAGESVSALAGQINGLGITGVSASVSGGVLSVTSPTATTVTSSVKQDVAGATVSYDFGSSGSTLSTVNTGTNLTLTGLTATGASATITAPTVTSGESVATYATALTSALSNAGIVGVTVNNAGGKLSITGANLSTSGSVIQDPVASSATTGTLSFDSNGNLTSPATNVSGLTFSGLSDGAATLDLNWNLFGTTGTSAVTQTASTSTTGSATQNGYASGQYNGLSVNSSGVVTASFSNNQNEIVGQLALATVSNQEGLQAEGSTNYATTTASGNAAIGVAGAGGRGTLEDSTLEGSNVDISSEFSSLIVAQRAFEANSKAVTTFDTVTQEAIGMIH